MSGMGKKVEKLVERYYPDYRNETDIFREVLQPYLESAKQVLDAGCGNGRQNPLSLQEQGRTVVGLDVDWAIHENQMVDWKVVGSLDALPFREDFFQLVVLRYVVEHLQEPDVGFQEISRTLSPGGRVVMLTPNALHYVPLVARLSPHSFHVWFNKKRGLSEHEIFPTYYRANTLRSLARRMQRVGLRLESARMFEARPNYLMFARIPFLLGLMYERVVNRMQWLSCFRVNIIAVFAKPRLNQGSGGC